MNRPHWVPVGAQGQRSLVVGPVELRRHTSTLLDVLGPGWSLLGTRLDRDPPTARESVRACARRRPPSVRVLVNTRLVFLGVYNGGPNLIEFGVRRRFYVVSLFAEDLRSATERVAA